MLELPVPDNGRAVRNTECQVIDPIARKIIDRIDEDKEPIGEGMQRSWRDIIDEGPPYDRHRLCYPYASSLPMKKLFDDVLEHVTGYYTEVVRLLPRLAMAILVFIMLFLIANWIRDLTRRRLTRRMRDPLLAMFLARFAKSIIVVMAIVFMMRIIGLGGLATGIVAGAGVGAFIIGFAFKDIGENFLAGMLLAFKRPFRIGDTVEINSVKGKIVSLNLRDTQIKTDDGRDVFVPNANIMKNPIMNFTMDGFLRHEFLVRVESISDLLRARVVITDTLHKEPSLLTGERQPRADIAEVGPNHVDIRVTYWLDHDDRSLDVSMIRTHTIQHVLEALRNTGMKAPGNVVEIKRTPE